MTRNSKFCPAAQELLAFHKDSSRNGLGSNQLKMDTQLFALLMFPALTYLLFRRPASMAPKRYPTELDFQIGHSVMLKKELLKGTLDKAGDHVE